MESPSPSAASPQIIIVPLCIINPDMYFDNDGSSTDRGSAATGCVALHNDFAREHAFSNGPTSIAQDMKCCAIVHPSAEIPRRSLHHNLDRVENCDAQAMARFGIDQVNLSLPLSR